MKKKAPPKRQDCIQLRINKLKEMRDNGYLPHSTSTRVIVPCLSKSFGFYFGVFQKHQNILGSAITQTQFKELIRRANRIIDEELIVKEKKENEPFFMKISVLLKICIIISVIGFLLLAFIVYIDVSKDLSDILLVVSMLLILFSVVIAVLCPFFLYRTSYYELKYEKIIEDRLEELVAAENLKSRNENLDYLTWEVGTHFFWLALNIERHKIYTRRLHRRLNSNYTQV